MNESNQAEQTIVELENEQNSNAEFRKNIEKIRSTLQMAENNISGNGITKEFVDQYVDKIFVTPEADGSIKLEIKMFTGESTQRYLEKLKSRAGHTVLIVIPDRFISYLTEIQAMSCCKINHTTYS